jgi:hypothetical protein
MTIKQYGGVFGRNPTFNNVTIEGTLTFDGDIDINSDLTIGGNLDVTGTVTADGLTVNGITSFTQKAVFGNNKELRWIDSGGTERTTLVLDSSNDLNLGTSAGGNLKFYNGSSYAERMRIDSSGNLLVGRTAATSAKLHLENATDVHMDMNSTGDNRGKLGSKVNDFYIGHSSSAANIIFKKNIGSDDHPADNGDETARIDGSGNLLVGTTDTTPYNNTSGGGFVVASNGLTSIARETTASNQAVLNLNNTGVDGIIAEFAKSGATVGSIGSTSGSMYIEGNPAAGKSGLTFFGSYIEPRDDGSPADAAIDLGSSDNRFKDLYRSGSTISTSDRNMKQDIRDLTDSERNVAVAAKGLLKAFRFIDRVAAEGDSANIHFGIIAQDLAAAFAAEGLDANDYQVYRSDTWTDDEGNEQARLGICYENLLAFIIAAI